MHVETTTHYNGIANSTLFNTTAKEEPTNPLVEIGMEGGIPIPAQLEPTVTLVSLYQVLMPQR
jgi:hypothetical protein